MARADSLWRGVIPSGWATQRTCDGRFQPRRHPGPRGRGVNAEPQVYTFLGNGTGAFLASTPAGDTHAWGIVAIDLDGDGNVDIVTADYGYNTVSFAKGNGRGRFGAIKSYCLAAESKEPASDKPNDGRLQ